MPALTDIESKLFSAKDFRLENGQILPVLELAYETYGSLNAKADNAVLVVHGYTSSHHAAGKNAAGKEGRGVPAGAAGWFDGLIGPGKAVDTDTHFVISVNALGSAHGSSGPNAIDPRTKKPYGPTFPHITMRDMVASQKLLVELVRHQAARRGGRPVDGRLPVVPVGRELSRIHEGHRRLGDGAARAQSPGRPRVAAEAAGRAIPNWNGGWYYENGGIPATLEQIRYETLLNYGQDEATAKVAAKSWAQIYDGHSLVTLRRAIDGFDITGEYAKLKGTKVLYVNLQDRQAVRHHAVRRIRAWPCARPAST